MGITLKDVAEYANVSMSTVSRVINQKGIISDETTQRVEEAIAALMYKPTSTATRLSTQERKIAIIVPGNPNLECDGYRFGIDANALISAIETRGHIPLVTTIKYSLNSNASNIHKMIEKGEVDGVIICDSCDDDKTKKLCISNNMPYICTNGISDSKTESYVDYDNADGAYQVIKYLTELGHKKIGLISGPQIHAVTKNRLYGVYMAIEKLGLNEEDFTTIFSEYTIEGGEIATKELVKKGDITAIFAFSDRLAVSAMTTLRSMNINIPNDMSLVGFDDMEICQLVYPTLTSVKRYSDEISPTIVEALLKLIDSKSMKQIKILYDTNLIVRDSCKRIK